MQSRFRFVVGAIAAWGLIAGGGAIVSAADLTIGTGSTSGVYFQVGRGICRLVNAGSAAHGLNCQALSTAGSIFNLKGVRAGDMQIAVAQSDWQFHAVKGSGPFADANADPDLRALFSVHGEPFTVVARRDSGIRSLGDQIGRASCRERV